MFTKFSQLKKSHRLVATLLIAIGIISFWRGAWGLQDVYLFPGNLPLSYTISTVLGLVVIVVSHHTLD